MEQVSSDLEVKMPTIQHVEYVPTDLEAEIAAVQERCRKIKLDENIKLEPTDLVYVHCYDDIIVMPASIIDSDYIRRRIFDDNGKYKVSVDCSVSELMGLDFMRNWSGYHNYLYRRVMATLMFSCSIEQIVKDTIYSICDDYPFVKGFNDTKRYSSFNIFDISQVRPTPENKKGIAALKGVLDAYKETVDTYELEIKYDKYEAQSVLLKPIQVEQYYSITQEQFDEMLKHVNPELRKILLRKVLSTYNMYHFGLRHLDKEIFDTDREKRYVLTRLLYFMYKEEHIFKSHVTLKHRYVIDNDLYKRLSTFGKFTITQCVPTLLKSTYFKHAYIELKKDKDIIYDQFKHILDDHTYLTGSYLAYLVRGVKQSYGDIDIGIACDKADFANIVKKKLSTLNVDTIIEVSDIRTQTICLFDADAVMIKVKLEFFHVFSTGISLVSRFHVPPVRMYRDSTGTYMLPSCFIANKTCICLDVRYFSSEVLPQEIIQKYINRGYAFHHADSIVRMCVGATRLINGYSINNGVIEYRPLQKTNPF